MIELRPGTFSYRASGDYIRDGKLVAAPIVTAAVDRPLAVMRHQVTTADYLRCVEAQACPVIDADVTSGDLPVVKVSWRDAQAYASWLSRATASRFRLPTDQEWVYAAGSRFTDDALPETFDPSDPGQRALAIYDRNASRGEVVDKAPRPLGHFGANENGLFDLAGNVWEWTDTCFSRHALQARGESVTSVTNCGVRVVEGRHRAYMTDFVREARAGGCSVGAPPTNLGFRLVRDDAASVVSPLSSWIRGLVGNRG